MRALRALLALLLAILATTQAFMIGDAAHCRWRRVQRTGRLSVAEEELPAYLAQYSNADAGQSEADRVVVAGQSKRVLSSWLAMCTPSRWNTQETVEYQNTLVLATI
ncbi:hypothetical protein Y032_0008g81 [Ancylostoma ceylanicum]|uniref:SCP domain-containing protein n=1 Tax=Ancylostoma ceylanicum TaxID=53326 RepID=A0A016VL06_9BILA|nr:hypothetical protein Y032_0008g81 [Ancylostoma ceylanicum]